MLAMELVGIKGEEIDGLLAECKSVNISPVNKLHYTV